MLLALLSEAVCVVASISPRTRSRVSYSISSTLPLPPDQETWTKSTAPERNAITLLRGSRYLTSSLLHFPRPTSLQLTVYLFFFLLESWHDRPLLLITHSLPQIHTNTRRRVEDDDDDSNDDQHEHEHFVVNEPAVPITRFPSISVAYKPEANNPTSSEGYLPWLPMRPPTPALRSLSKHGSGV
jgi:hypothetical protein